MNKYRKALDNIGEYFEENSGFELMKSVTTLTEIVDKSTPKELVEGWMCPVCGFTMFDLDEFVHYCSYCGQKLINEDSE